MAKQNLLIVATSLIEVRGSGGVENQYVNAQNNLQVRLSVFVINTQLLFLAAVSRFYVALLPFLENDTIH